jgi:S-formylglutathione hydrolase FrmB
VQPGTIAEHGFPSAALGVNKRYLVYVPATYAADQRPYPVIYLLHGLGGDETNWTQHGDLVRAADRLGLRALVVMPDGDAGFYVNSRASARYDDCLSAKPPFSPGEPPSTFCVKTPRYDDYVTRDLVADVDARYRTAKSRAGRGIAGLSMGGFGALSLAMKHPDVFSAAAATSGLASLRYAGPHPYRDLASVEIASPSRWGRDYPERVAEHVRAVFGADEATWRSNDPIALAETLEPGRLALRIDCGESDDFRFDDHARHLHDVLTARGIQHEFQITAGTHLFDYWKARLPEILAFMRNALGAS